MKRVTMRLNELVTKLFGFNQSTFYRWKKEERPVVVLIEKYFTQKDLEEFVTTGTIKEFDNFKEIRAGEDFKLFLEFQEFMKHKRGEK